MTARMIRNATRKIGGKADLLDILCQWAQAGETDLHHTLRRQLDENLPLEGIFAQISEGGPYVDIRHRRGSLHPEIDVCYGNCYGGTCGIALIHRFQRPNEKWKLLPGEGRFIIH